jgi:hypothetical protein
MSHLRRARLGARRPSDHERARRLAAEDLHEPLGAEQSAWLEAHLAECPACAAVAAEYVAQREALRALPKADPPRDLWARTSAALDREQAHRASGRRVGVAFERRQVPEGALAGALVVAVVVTTSIFSTGIGLLGEVAPPATGAPPSQIQSFAAAPSPVTVAAADVSWLAPQDDGTYALNVAPVDRVCPPEAQPDCAPIDGSGRSVVMLSAAPRAVVKAPGKPEVVVVDAATRTSGGSVYVVALGAPGASASPGQSPTPIPIATAEPSPSIEPSASLEPSGSPSPSPSELPASESPSAPSPTAPGPSGSAAASPSPSASPSGSGVVAIATDVIVVGETAAYSPDGLWFAFTARPADGSQGPDIYVWHVGDPAAHPATTDHASVFSAWDGSLVIGSHVTPAGIIPAASPEPSPSDGSLPGSPEGVAPSSPDASPAASAGPTALPETSMAPVPGAGASSELSPSIDASASPTPPPTLAIPDSFLLDPATGIVVDLAVAAWRPVLDPSGRYVVYWDGTMRLDETSGLWTPWEGRLVIAPWSWLASGSGSGAAGQGVLLPVFSNGPGTDGSSGEPEVSPESSSIPESPSPSPSPAQSGSAAPLPGDTPPSSPEASVSPTPFGPLTSPEPLLGPDATGQVPIVRDWDVRWDPAGSHLAVWLGDAFDPQLGRLSLLVVDPATGRIDRSTNLLTDEPALAGFSIAGDRLAWATPSGQDGEGSRLQVFAWMGEASGTVDGQPTVGPDQVVVVR